MIEASISEIGPDEIRRLVAEATPEGRTLDYKQTLPEMRVGGSQSKQTRKILDTVVAFANTAGGDIVFGLAEQDGHAGQVVGLNSATIDEAIRGLEDCIRSSTSPRLEVDIQEVSGLEEGTVLVLRVSRSWQSPHAAVEGKHSRFYRRGNRQNVLMTISEVREMFLKTEAVNERLLTFRRRRVQHIQQRDGTPVKLAGLARLVFHLLPLQPRSAAMHLALEELARHSHELQPLGASGWDHRSNFDGLLTLSTLGGEFTGYTQLFRDGAVEAVTALPFLDYGSLKPSGEIPTNTIERDLAQGLSRYAGFLSDRAGLQPPYMAFVSLVDVSGYVLTLGPKFRTPGGPRGVDRPVLEIGGVLVSDIQASPERILRPIFDVIWQSAGYPRAHSYDGTGNWSMV